MTTSDWADLDAIVQTVLDLAREDDVALQVPIAIAPIVGACPDEACGT